MTASIDVEQWAAERSIAEGVRARKWAGAVEVFCALYGIASVIAGIQIGTIARASDCSTIYGDYECDSTDHPFAWLGVGIAFAGLFTVAVIMMIAQYIRWRISHADATAASS